MRAAASRRDSSAGGRSRPLILLYHGVERRPGPLFVEPSLFAEHLDAMSATGATLLTLAALADGLAAGRLPERAAVVTFDDGFASVVEHAAPALAERAMPATVFCVAGHVGGTNDWPTGRPGTPPAALAGRDDLRALAGAGIEIGSHGTDHAPLTTADPETIRREVVDSRAALEEIVGGPVETYAYPYGAAPTPAARRAVAETYRAACTTTIGRVGPGCEPALLPRVDAHYLRDPERLARALAGELELYLGARRVGARARRLVRKDYVAAP